VILIDKVEVINLIPKFLMFYEKANVEGLDNNDRWSLWEEYYNFAAVPPGDDGRKLAKKLFEQAWGKYQEHIDYITKWSPSQQKVENYLNEVKDMLGCDISINFVLIYFVGAFEENAFVAPYDQKRLALCLPIENASSDILLVHELSHIVHSRTANLSAEWERTIASTILQEGLAAQISKYLVPGKSDELYIENIKNWLKSCEAQREKIIKGIFPYLEDSSSETVYKFTTGNGTTNHEREAYYVGWELVKTLLEEDVTFEELAKIKEEDIPNFLLDNFKKLLK
jgi:hypothetical protein